MLALDPTYGITYNSGYAAVSSFVGSVLFAIKQHIKEVQLQLRLHSLLYTLIVFFPFSYLLPSCLLCPQIIQFKHRVACYARSHLCCERCEGRNHLAAMTTAHMVFKYIQTLTASCDDTDMLKMATIFILSKFYI